MADADDFDVEELRALLRGESPPSAGAKAGSRPAVKKDPTPPAAKAKAARGKGSGRAAAAKSPRVKAAAATKRGKR